MTTRNRVFKKNAGLLVAAVGLTASLMIATPGAAFADVVNGQFVSKNGLRCGGQERVTGSVSVGPTDLKQYSWIYYNCSDRTLRRKANIDNLRDGDCRGIGPGQARVLHTLLDTPLSPINRYKGTKAC